jgi:hypothetical protein
MANYPSSPISLTNPTNGVDYVSASWITALNGEVKAIGDELGTVPKGTAADVKTRITNIENGYLPAGKTRRLQIESVKGGTSPPVETFLTGTNCSTNVLWFDETTAMKIHFCFVVPPDWDSATNIALYIAGTPASTATGSDTVKFFLYYIARANNETITDGASEKTKYISTNIGAASQAVNKVYMLSDATNGIFSYGDLAEGDIVSCTITRDTAVANDAAYDYGIVHLWLQYTNKKQ